jgi:AAA domain
VSDERLPPDALTKAVEDMLAARGPAPAPESVEEVPILPSPTLDDVLDTEEPDYDWLVPGLLERGDRLIVTGREGKGKSTFLRQLGVQLAAGVHPFTLEPIEAIATFYLDAENSRRQSRRHLHDLREAAAGAHTAGPVRYEFRPNGLDLTRGAAQAWLRERLGVNETQLLILGPSYKLATGDPTSEETARTVTHYLDTLRAEYGVTLIIEAHTPYADTTKGKRPERPYGASLWSRWPEFGLFLGEDGTITHWRGPRDERQWPAKLCRSAPWPWAVDAGAATTPTERHLDHVEHIIAVLTVTPGLSQKQLEDAARSLHPEMSRSAFASARNRAVYDGTITLTDGARGAKCHWLASQADPALDLPDDF